MTYCMIKKIKNITFNVNFFLFICVYIVYLVPVPVHAAVYLLLYSAVYLYSSLYCTYIILCALIPPSSIFHFILSIFAQCRNKAKKSSVRLVRTPEINTRVEPWLDFNLILCSIYVLSFERVTVSLC